MKPVDDKIVNAIQSKGRGSNIFTFENIEMLENNPNQWFEMASVINDENYMGKQASFISSARYFRDRLKAQRDMNLEFKGSQNKYEQSARLYVRNVRVIRETDNGTN